jgi:hypothetical protein
VTTLSVITLSPCLRMRGRISSNPTICYHLAVIYSVLAMKVSQSISPSLVVGKGRNNSSNGSYFERLVRSTERQKVHRRNGGLFLPTYNNCEVGKTNVWVVTPAALAVDKTSGWQKNGALSGVEYDACILQHHRPFPNQDTLLDCKNWATGGVMDIRSLADTSKASPQTVALDDVRSKISSVIEQMNRQLIGAASLAIETDIPAHVEWIFSHSKTLFLWGEILFRPHTVRFIDCGEGKDSWATMVSTDGTLPPEVSNLFDKAKQRLVAKAQDSYSIVRPGSGTRKIDDFNQRLSSTKISFRSFSRNG